MYPPAYDPSLTLESRRFLTLCSNPSSPSSPSSPSHNTKHPLDQNSNSLLTTSLFPLEHQTNPHEPLLSTFANRAEPERDLHHNISGNSCKTKEKSPGLASNIQRGPCPKCVEQQFTYLVELVNCSLLTNEKLHHTIVEKKNYDAVILLYSVTDKGSLSMAESLYDKFLRESKPTKTGGRKKISLFRNNTYQSNTCEILDRKVVVALLGTKMDLDGPGEGELGIDVDELLTAARHMADISTATKNDISQNFLWKQAKNELEEGARSMEAAHHSLHTSGAAWSKLNNSLSPMSHMPSDSSLAFTEEISQANDNGSVSKNRKVDGLNDSRIHGESFRHSDSLNGTESIVTNSVALSMRHSGFPVFSTQKFGFERLDSGSLASFSLISRSLTPPIDAKSRARPVSVSPYILSSPQLSRFCWEKDLPQHCQESAKSFNQARRVSVMSVSRKSARTTSSLQERLHPAPDSYSRIRNTQYSDNDVRQILRRSSQDQVIESWLDFETPAAINEQEDISTEHTTNSDGALDGKNDISTVAYHQSIPKQEANKKIQEENLKKREVFRKDAEEVARRLSLPLPVMECSSKTGEGVDAAFEAVIREVLKKMNIALSEPPEDEWSKACAHRRASKVIQRDVDLSSAVHIERESDRVISTRNASCTRHSAESKGSMQKLKRGRIMGIVSRIFGSGNKKLTLANTVV